MCFRTITKHSIHFQARNVEHGERWQLTAKNLVETPTRYRSASVRPYRQCTETLAWRCVWVQCSSVSLTKKISRNYKTKNFKTQVQGSGEFYRLRTRWRIECDSTLTRESGSGGSGFEIQTFTQRLSTALRFEIQIQIFTIPTVSISKRIGLSPSFTLHSLENRYWG